MMKILRYLKPYQSYVTIILLLLFVQALADLYLPTLLADIVDTGIVKGDIPYIMRVGGFMLLIAAAGAACSITASYLSSKVSAGFGKILRNQVFSHVENFSLQEFDKIGTASLITRTTNDVTQIQQVLQIMLRIMVSAPLMCIGGIIMAASKDAKLSLIFMAIIPILTAAVMTILLRGLPLFKIMQSKLDKLNLILREGLTGIRVIRSFNRIDYEKQRFDHANLDLTDTTIKANRIMAALMPAITLIFNFSTIAIIWFGGIRISNGNMQVGALMAFLQYAIQIMFSLIMVSLLFILIPRASASVIRINEVLDMVPIIKDLPQAATPSIKKGQLDFCDVTFSYPGAEQPALSHISFCANPGEITAIIGGTGAGKSTLMNLIPRFYDIDSGSISIDGIDIREMPQKVLREKIGLVPQKAILFSGTVADNIRYGKQSASDQEVEHAARIAQAEDFISGMDDGFQAAIAQGGTNVSGGQKQRLAIARTLIRKPEIYLFDDSFSALDFKTDANLRTALKPEIRNSTVIIIAQRISTIIDSDRIIVLEAGQIVGNGKHAELMNTCGVYLEIVASQLTAEEIA